MRLGVGGGELQLDQVLAADAAAPVLPELRLQRAERDPAVGALVGPVADDAAREEQVAALRHDAVAEVLAGDHRQPRQRAVGHRDVDQLTLARALALVQRGEDAERGHQRAAAEVGDLPGRLHRRAARLAGQPEQADQPQVVHVVAGAVAHRAVLAVAADRAVDDPRVHRAHRLVADAEAVEHAGPEGLEHDVGAGDEPQQHLAPGGLLEVDPHRGLVAVQREEQRPLRGVLGALVVGRRPAHVVAHPEVLDLDHLGAEVGQQQRAEPARQQAGEVEDADALKREAHGRVSWRSCRGVTRQRAWVFRGSRAPVRRWRACGRCPASSGAPSRRARRWSGPSCRRAGRGCPRGRRGSTRRA